MEGRIIFAGDIRAVEAKYHHKCLQLFQLGQSKNSMPQNPRNLEEINASTFENLCYWLESSEGNDKQYTLIDLRKQMSLPAYSVKHLQRKILQHFGERITVSGSQGDANVITLHEK